MLRSLQRALPDPSNLLPALVDATIVEEDVVVVAHGDVGGEITDPESSCVTLVGKKDIETPIVQSQLNPSHNDSMANVSKSVILDYFNPSLNELPLPDCDKDLNHFQFLLTVQNQLIAKGFSASVSIHSLEAIDFYRRILKAPEFVLNVLEFGYKPEFSSELQLPYFEKNNASALKEMDFVRYYCLLFSIN